MAIVTKEWKELIWDGFLKKVLKVVGYTLLIPASLCLLFAACGAFLAIYLILGALWLASLGHINLIEVWHRILSRELDKLWSGDIGTLLKKIYFGEEKERSDSSKES